MVGHAWVRDQEEAINSEDVGGGARQKGGGSMNYNKKHVQEQKGQSIVRR